VLRVRERAGQNTAISEQQIGNGKIDTPEEIQEIPFPWGRRQRIVKAGWQKSYDPSFTTFHLPPATFPF
jgi:hypothetical protein